MNMSPVRHWIVCFVVYTQVHNLDADSVRQIIPFIQNRLGGVNIIGNAFP